MTPNHPWDNDDCAAYRVGNWTDECGECGGRYAIFRREMAEKILGCKVEDLDDDIAMAQDLTGWYRFDCGPGRAFGREPCVRVYKHAVLVYQRTGLDI